MSGCRSFWEFLRGIRIEPILFLFCIGSYTYSSGAGVLTIQKVCFPDGPPGVTAVCKDTRGLQAAAETNQVRTILRECLPALMVILMGSWRDLTHRNLPLLISAHLGEILATVADLVSSCIWGLSPLLIAVISSLLSGLGGGRTTLTMVALSYITETTTPEERALRMPALMVSILGGVCVSLFGGGLVLTLVGYTAFFGGLVALYCLSLAVTLLLIKDQRPLAVPSSLSSYLRLLTRLKIVFHPRPNSVHIWAFIVASSLITCMLAAEGTVSYLFMQKKFNFTPSEAGFLGGYKMLISLITAGFATPLLKKLLNISDFKIVAICFVPSLISIFGMPFAETEGQLYIFATLDLLRIVLIATILHLFTGCLKKSEVGIFTSFLSFMEGILPIGLNPLYTFVFNKTVDTMPGAFYFISGSTLLLSAALLWILSFSYEPYVEREDEEPVDQSKEDLSNEVR